MGVGTLYYKGESEEEFKIEISDSDYESFEYLHLELKDGLVEFVKSTVSRVLAYKANIALHRLNEIPDREVRDKILIEIAKMIEDQIPQSDSKVA